LGEHTKPTAMIRESLPQYLTLTRIGIEHRIASTQSVLGYPAATLLFVVVDTIGNYCRGQTVKVEGKPDQEIDDAWKSFFVLNHPYFGYKLEFDDFKRLYDLSRSPLIHGGSIGEGVRITVDEPVADGLEFGADGWIRIFLPALLERCELAVARFLKDADQIVAGARVTDDLYLKVNAAQLEKLRASLATSGWGESASATAKGPGER